MIEATMNAYSGTGVEQVRVRILPDGRMDRRNSAAYIGKSERTLANLQSQGKGPKCFKVGGRVFYYRADLDAYIRGDDRAA